MRSGVVRSATDDSDLLDELFCAAWQDEKRCTCAMHDDLCCCVVSLHDMSVACPVMEAGILCKMLAGEVKGIHM